ncbi:hypothetical protein ACFO1B_43660 [Dactylosporangium siamense]|uniref:Uncharacterized protein n=1 Tax=Dactylosporangium siamense TaxID=685454 RepID=A0A919Q081_9ACTN|nr:hypothetical protein [Dactylosporangium siamense]GIG52892.1 hypothetical protein Dsi01nite_109330 [Dactylosporangium siamense]
MTGSLVNRRHPGRVLRFADVAAAVLDPAADVAGQILGEQRAHRQDRPFDVRFVGRGRLAGRLQVDAQEPAGRAEGVGDERLAVVAGDGLRDDHWAGRRMVQPGIDVE